MAHPNNLVLAGKSLQAVSYMLITNALIYVIISLIIAYGYETALDNDIDPDSIEGILIGLYVIIAIISIIIISEIYKAGALLIKSGESDNN